MTAKNFGVTTRKKLFHGDLKIKGLKIHLFKSFNSKSNAIEQRKIWVDQIDVDDKETGIDLNDRKY